MGRERKMQNGQKRNCRGSLQRTTVSGDIQVGGKNLFGVSFHLLSWEWGVGSLRLGKSSENNDWKFLRRVAEIGIVVVCYPY